MENQFLRVLHVTEVLEAAGIESFIMNIYRNIDRNKLQFDFMVMREYKEFYDPEIKKLGGKKFTINCMQYKNIFLRILAESKELYRFLKNNPYDVIHIHTCTPLRAFYLYAAKTAGIPVRIYHSHSANITDKALWKKQIFNFLRVLLSQWATDYFACSKAAAEWMFSPSIIAKNKYKIVYNGINTENYKFDISNRLHMRSELNLENAFVMINIGRFLEQKNQCFVIDVFREIKKQKPSAQLLFLGKGPMEETLEKYAIKSGFGNSIHFLKIRDDVNKLLSATDVFLMPSLYEGLPVAAIEAQCNGVTCVLSTNITEEVIINKNAWQLSLDKSSSEWAQSILKNTHENYDDRIKTYLNIKEAGYDVKNVAQMLQEYYTDILEKYSK